MRSLLFGLITVLLSCASEPLPVAKKADTPPYYRRYIKKDHELIYVVSNFGNQIDSVSQKFIDDSIKRFDPEIILTKYPIESKFEFGNEISACESGLGCTTAASSCMAAKRRGISCISGEPYHTEILKEALRFVKKPDDILFFYTYRSLVTTLPGKKDPLLAVDSLIEENKKILHLSSTFDKYDFIRTYKEKIGPSIKIGQSYLKPVEEGNYLQRLSFIVQRSYLNLLFKKIDQEQSSHKRVMFVYDPATFTNLEKKLKEYYSDHIP